MLKYASAFPNASFKATLFTCERTELNTQGAVLHPGLKSMPLDKVDLGHQERTWSDRCGEHAELLPFPAEGGFSLFCDPFPSSK